MAFIHRFLIRDVLVGAGNALSIGLRHRHRGANNCSLIASESVDGMDLATEFAKTDPNPKVQAELGRADRYLASLLAAARDQTWALIAKRGYAHESETR
jgi:hypothetical protein